MTYQDVKNIASELGWAVNLDEGRLHFCLSGEKFTILANSAVELISKVRLLAYNYAEDQPFKDKLDELTEVLVKNVIGGKLL